MNSEIVTTSPKEVIMMRMDREKFPALMRVPAPTAVEQLTSIVSNAFMYRGQRASDDDVKFIAVNLYSELMADENGCGTDCISIAEISRTVKKAVLGQAKELYGISVASLYACIVDYCKGEGHHAELEIKTMAKEKRLALLKSSALNTMTDAYAAALIAK